jgi:hypothetical protein
VCVNIRVTLVPAICAPDREYDPPVYQVVRSSKFVYNYYYNLQAPLYTAEWFSRVVPIKSFEKLKYNLTFQVSERIRGSVSSTVSSSRLLSGN